MAVVPNVTAAMKTKERAAFSIRTTGRRPRLRATAAPSYKNRQGPSAKAGIGSSSHEPHVVLAVLFSRPSPTHDADSADNDDCFSYAPKDRATFAWNGLKRSTGLFNMKMAPFRRCYKCSSSDALGSTFLLCRLFSHRCFCTMFSFSMRRPS
jgi:hypothetical protein